MIEIRWAFVVRNLPLYLGQIVVKCPTADFEGFTNRSSRCIGIFVEDSSLLKNRDISLGPASGFPPRFRSLSTSRCPFCL